MAEHTIRLATNPRLFGTPLVTEPSPGQLSGDAGLLPVRQFDQRIGLTQAFAATLDDPRDPDLTEHGVLEMVRSLSSASSPAARTGMAAATDWTP
jgi:hypothetical protein